MKAVFNMLEVKTAFIKSLNFLNIRVEWQVIIRPTYEP